MIAVKTSGWLKTTCGSAYQVVVGITSLLLLAYFLLPNTFWANISPLSWFLAFEIGSSHLSWVLALSLTVGAVLLVFWRSLQRNIAGTNLLVLTSIYTLAYAATALIWHKNLQQEANCFLVLSSFAVGLLTAQLCTTATNTVYILIVVADIQALYTIYYRYIGVNEFYSGDVVRAGGTFGHPNGIYTLMLSCLPLVINNLVHAKARLLQVALMVSVALIFASLLLTWYRGPMLAAAISIVWLCRHLFGQPRFVSGFVITVGILLIGMLLLVQYSRTNGTKNQASSSRSIQGRINLWSHGIQIAKNNWVSGVGIGALEIPIIVPSLENPNSTRSETSIEPKNILLYWLDEMGTLGGVLFVLFVIAVDRMVRNHLTDQMALGLGSAWLALLVAGLTDTPFGIVNRPYANALVGCLLGATLLLRRSQQELSAPHLLQPPLETAEKIASG